jgi:hypothetical protein
MAEVWWRYCKKCKVVVPCDHPGAERWNWHWECKVFDRPGRPKGMSKTLDFASHRKAYHPMLATERITEKEAFRMLDSGRATTELTVTELLGREGRRR